MRRTATAIAAVLVGLLAVPATAQDEPEVTDPTATSVPDCPDWAMYGGDHERTFEARCPSTLSAPTASSLTPAWVFKTEATVTASPAVAGERVFIGDWSGTVYALDAESGAELWRAATEPAPGAPFGPIVSSAAVTDVRLTGNGSPTQLVIVGAGPRLYAFDALDGSEVWVRYFGADVADEETEIESSPVVHAGVVYVGMDVHNRTVDQTGGVRGGVWALDAATGDELWFFNPELDNTASGCSSVWSSPTLDVEREQLYIATGNCPHDDYPWTPHTEAVTALRMEDGAPLWAFQPEPENRDDTDFGATPNLFRDRSGRELVGIGKKNAVYYALDPATGAEVWSTQVAEPGNVNEDFAIGGFIGSTAISRGDVFGGTAIGGPPYFHALDGKTGDVLWNGISGPTYAATATTNGVIVAGALDNELKVWDGRSGALLWASPLAGPISSSPAVVGDRLYIGSGTSSSDACAKDVPIISDLCLAAFDEALGRTGAVHAFEVRAPGHAPATSGTGTGILLGGEGNRLHGFDLATLEHQVVIPSAADDPEDGLDINAQICVFPDGSGRIIAGEDTDQGGEGVQGWGIIRLEGDGIGDLTYEQVGKLAPTFQDTRSNPENYGCGFLSDGRVLTGDVGDQFPGFPGNGQLIVWFPPFDRFEVEYCKIDTGIATAGGIWVDDDDVYIASNRPDEAGNQGGIYRYSGTWPTGPDAAGGCGRTDGTGAPLVDDGRVTKELFIPQDEHVVTPSAIVASGRDTFYVSSVFNGVIAEYDTDGAFLREIVRAPGTPAQTTGTPFGLAVGADGSLYYADLGILAAQPAPSHGTFRRIRFDDAGEPLPPETLGAGFDFADGAGIWFPPELVEEPHGDPPPPATSPAPAPLPTTGAGAAVLGLAALSLAALTRRRH